MRPYRSGRAAAPNSASSAGLRVSYEALRVIARRARELAERFLDEHKVARSEQAAEVSRFLDTEAERVRIEIAELEKQLADFKTEELRQLPELLNTNLRLFEKAEQDIEATEQRVRAHEDRLEALRAELSLTQPYEQVRTESGSVLLSADDRLSVLISNYLQATARYSAQHPDVIRLRREITVLAEQTGSGARADELMNQLVNLQDQLRSARQRYSEEHPEVARLERAVAAVQRGFETAIISGDSKSDMATAPTNARYVALKTQIDTTVGNISVEKERLVALNQKLAEYESRLYQTPGVERDFKSLARDYDNATRKYHELKEKQLQARMAEQLEAGSNAERWVLVSPAYLPTFPESPNRLGILLLGAMFAGALALACVALAEFLDKTVRSARAVMATLGAPPLVVIPQMRSGARLARLRTTGG
jgi:uncharacterized protein involved in exopolysaccharide biosynthesis